MYLSYSSNIIDLLLVQNILKHFVFIIYLFFTVEMWSPKVTFSNCNSQTIKIEEVMEFGTIKN